MIKEAIQKAVDGHDLTEAEATAAMTQIMEGEATPAQIAALVTALRIKGESVEEITGFARVMRLKATLIPHDQPVLADTCGTGGDNSNTFNISTTAAFVAAGAGVRIAKHGNRALTSRSGSADVLHALGVNIDASPERVGICIDKAGLGFLFAASLHSAMKQAGGVRKEIGIRTVFNILGPLTNPAGAKHQVVGVFDADYAEKLALVLGNLGSKHALVVHGEDGLDEITLTGETRVAEWKDGKVRAWHINPEEYGFTLCEPKALLGGDAAHNAEITRAVLKGAAGPQRDIVVLNAAAALVAADKVATLREGVAAAATSLDSGAALKVLDDLVRYSNAS
jgi:anthranilate phosphoribosyltransferase